MLEPITHISLILVSVPEKSTYWIIFKYIYRLVFLLLFNSSVTIENITAKAVELFFEYEEQHSILLRRNQLFIPGIILPRLESLIPGNDSSILAKWEKERKQIRELEERTTTKVVNTTHSRYVSYT